MEEMSYLPDSIDSERIKSKSRLRESDCLPDFRRRKLDEKIAARMFAIRENRSRHNPYDQEQRELNAIAQGDTAALEQSILEEYAGQLGTLNEEDSLRNIKNICIVVITLASRAAIRGGMSPELAFAASDIFISEMERCRHTAVLSRICRGAEYWYARVVHEIREHSYTGITPTPAETQSEKDPFRQLIYTELTREKKRTQENEHVSRAKDYIYRNLHGRIGTEEIAEALALNPRYLSTLFHRETGMTISQYIRQEKIRLVKNMLTYSEYSYLEIAHYLGFSSQSHLGDIFRKETGMTLKEYRQMYQRKDSLPSSAGDDTL
ncbi:MAG: helix-turn-helix transcriptional regulator [Lachnospiraceae bacterium]|nr:helix-turn-helix transcriptional regulator [Lachnospiraceae bacterium]